MSGGKRYSKQQTSWSFRRATAGLLSIGGAMHSSQQSFADSTESSPSLRQAKRLVTLLDLKVDSIMLLRRPELRTLTGLLPSHFPLNYHLYKLDLAGFNVCRPYKELVETADHILCDFEAIAKKRWQYFGRTIWSLLSYGTLLS